jgi:hypothetical protein
MRGEIDYVDDFIDKSIYGEIHEAKENICI